MYYPEFDEIRQLRAVEMNPAAEKGECGCNQHGGTPLLPLYCDILADLETPVSAY